MLIRKHIFLVITFLSATCLLQSQDLIYLNNGSKFEAKVKELTPSEIKYKNINNPDGPTYVISKSDVLLIEYKNGNVDVINKNPMSVSPKSLSPATAETKVAKKPSPTDLYYLNKNAIHINALALVNADITLMYERDFANNHLSVLALGGYNFNKVTTWPNLYIKSSLANTKKNYDAGLGLNFFPSTRRKAQYFLGVLVKYMNYSFDREVLVQEVVSGVTYDKLEIQKAEGYQIATMLLNGFQVRLTPAITYKAFIGIGPFSADADLKKELYGNSESTFPKAYLGICIGYRF